jgi:hypothetical protein
VVVRRPGRRWATGALLVAVAGAAYVAARSPRRESAAPEVSARADASSAFEPSGAAEPATRATSVAPFEDVVPGVLRGVVRDERGAPIPGARAFLLEVAPGPSGVAGAGVVVDAARTDARGAYRLAPFAPGAHRLRVRAPGRAPFERALRGDDADDVALGTPLATTPPADGLRPLTGRVVRGDAGLPGAVVVGSRLDADADAVRATFAVVADDDGNFAVDVAPGRWRVRALPDDAGATEEADAEPDGAPVALVAAPLWTLRGRAVDERGAPLARWFLRTYFDGPRGRTPGPALAGRSADGSFALSGSLAGRCVVEVEAPGLPPATLAAVELAPPFRAVDLPPTTLDAGRAFYGRVVDDAGAPFPGADVAAPRAFRGERRARADDAGAFVLDGVPRDVAELVADHPEAVSSRAFSVPPETGAAPSDLGGLVLERGGAVEGVVRRADGSPDPRAEVQATEERTSGAARMKTAATDAEGRYRIGGLAPGTWRVRARKRDGAFAVDDADRGLAPPRRATLARGVVVRLDL